MNEIELKCHLISVVKTFDSPKVGKSLKRPVAGVNLEGYIQFCNPAFERLAGIPMSDLIGQNLEDLGQTDSKLGTNLNSALEAGVSADRGTINGTSVLWKYELISPGDAFLLISGELGNQVIDFPAKQAAG